MAIITLTSDLGMKDHSVASVKAFIYSLIPNANIVDVSHLVSPFNIAEAAYIVKNVYQDFPSRTIHLISVDSVNNLSEDFIMVLYKSQYLLARDNGLISLIIDGKPDKIIRLNIKSRSDLLFPLKYILAKAACRLAVTNNEYDLGTLVKEFNTIGIVQPTLESSIIRGTVIYIDVFGNAVTNITRSHFEGFENRKFRILVSHNVSIGKISELYSDVAEAEALAMFTNNGNLQIALSHGNANKLLGLEVWSKILVEFN